LVEELKIIIEDFNLVSYHAGINTAFAEVVGAGCKKLALSSPYEPWLADKMMEPTKSSVDKYGVLLEVEDDLITTLLFPKTIAEGKIVFLIAKSDTILNDYHKLKELKKESDKEGNPEKLEKVIALRFGKLLSYSPDKIRKLIEKNS
jgi:hypothetical protein